MFWKFLVTMVPKTSAIAGVLGSGVCFFPYVYSGAKFSTNRSGDKNGDEKPGRASGGDSGSWKRDEENNFETNDLLKQIGGSLCEDVTLHKVGAENALCSTTPAVSQL